MGTALARLADRMLNVRAAPWDAASGWTIMRGQGPGPFQATGREVRLRGWERNPVVNACMRAIVDILAAVDFQIYRLKADGTDEIVPGHDAELLLNMTPRADISGYALRARTGMHYGLYGNGLWHLERSGRRVVGVNPIHPEYLKYVWVNEFDQATRYDWQTLQGRPMQSPVEDIVHFKDLTAHPEALFGYPRAASALQDVVTDDEASQYVRQVVTNHGSAGIAILTEGVSNLADLEAAEEKWHNKFVERGQRGRTKFVAGVKDIKEIGFSLKDLEFPELRRIAREDICAVFSVDPRMIGIQSAARDGGLSGAQYIEARFRLIQQGVVPIMKSIESELNRWFMPEFGNYYVRFNPDTLSELTEDEGTTATRGLAEVAAGARTIEEYRDLVGLSAELDPTHHLVQQGQVVEVSVVLAESAKTPAEKAAALAPTETPTPNPGDAVPSPSPKEATASGRSAPLLRRTALTPDQRQMHWRTANDRATRDEEAYRVAARLQFEVERAGVGGLMADDPAIDAIIAQLASDYGPDGQYYRAWVDRYQSLIANTMQGAGDALVQSVGIDFNLENPRVRQLLTSRVNKLAGNVTDTTYQQILGFIDAGRAAGMGVRDVAGLINDGVFGGAAAQRAETIARTETIGALNAGEYAAALESGVFRSKSWLTQADDRVRDAHAAIDGQRVGLESLFSNGLRYPGDQNGPADQVVNCRCTLLYHDQEA